VALLRPAGRGATRYAYDLDGRALRKVAEAEAESDGASVGWEEVTLYATGRVVEVQHEDGTSERLTYYPDHLLATRTTREGVLVSYQYDAANRLLSATPSAASDADGERIWGAESGVPGACEGLVFGAESVGATQRYDAFGRVRESAGDGAGGPRALTEYGADAAGRERAGLPSRVSRGSAFSTSYAYDEAFNVEAVRTSQGTAERRRFDEWDRPVRLESGIAEGGSYATVGAGPCEGLAAGEAGAEGAAAELAYDATGHVVRERRLQQHLTGSGATACRWVETRYRYNAREQVVAVEQTHLASPTEPGVVVEAAQEVVAYEYDEHGRALRDVARNAVSADLVTTYRYDAAGRVVGVTVGQAGELVTGYDAKSRPVLRTDGDAGVWRGRWDAWDRLYREEPPTGAVVVRRFDEAHRPVRETVFDGAPELGGARLADRAMAVTSFGEVARLVEVLDVDPSTGVEELRVTERAFDEAGRVVRVLSGPPTAEGALDPARARRELERVYEADAGRVLVERFGGGASEGPLWERVLSYAPENRTPWPDAQTLRESVPGEAELRETWTTRWQRDAFGRPVAERRDDGRVLYTTYDRSGGAIATRTGAGTTRGSSQDGRGLPVALLRPSGRGATRAAYDLDGRLLRKVASSEPESSGASAGWEEVTVYDATGRVVEVQHEDGTSERLTYYPDHLVATRTTREGVLVSYQYDAANRLLSATPSAASGADGEPVTLPSSLAPLDAGDAYAWDALSRRTASRRGREGVSGYDASLEVAWPSFDLASRPREERVGARGALAWSWDTWNRPVSLELPSVARVGAFGAADPLRGWTRQYDTLDRLVDLAGVGAAAAGTPGATLAWGGRDRLYAMTTKSALGTGARLGYIAGAGAQPPGVGGGDGDGASRWRLGTLVWGGAAEGGAGAGSGADSGATAPPAAPWGSFGYAWRGSESSEGDALKVGRAVLGASDAFAGLGWTIGYDGADRVAEAVPGAGSLAGGGAEGGGGSGAGGAGSGSSPEGMGADAYSYEYGIGDELTRRIDQRTGELESVVSGADGRLLALDGETFGYDPAGRRTEDARFRYQWSWRGELVRLDVKEGAEEAWGSPYEGHMVRYIYDALGRLTSRTHWGPLPEGESDDTLRPFVERRDYVWDQQSRVAEIGYGDPEGAQVRWRKLYVPGPGGLDDAVQVVVQNVDGSEALYSILRDEIGSVIALVAEDETREGAGGTVDPTRPAIPVRYRYSPFGAALAETSPRVERLLFDNELVEVGGFRQADVPERDDAVAAAGALRVWLSAALDASTLGAGVVLESRTAGGAWTGVPAATPGGTEGLVLALDPETGTELRVLLVEGWRRGVAYRVRLRAELRDVLGRAPPASGPGGSASAAAPLQWTVPEGAGQAVAYEQRFASGERFESWAASGDTIGGRFPGGQNGLFHGLWTDPVSGISYARARWYDARTGSFLSEDPLRDVDSPNLYQYGFNSPFNFSDPRGLQASDPELRLIYSLIQSAADDAAEAEGVTNWLDELKAGSATGTRIHARMTKMLSPGGKYHHPRILTEVAVSERGTIVDFYRNSRPAGSLVKDVVILREGTTKTDIARFGTKAKDVTLAVVDLKVGRHGADPKQGETLRRFGVTNIKLKLRSNFEAKQAASRIRWANKIRGVPLLAGLAIGLTAAEAKAAIDEGDLDHALNVMTGLDLIEDAANLTGEALEKELREYFDGLGATPEKRCNAMEESGAPCRSD
jgi:RHS repeat-associated protein